MWLLEEKKGIVDDLKTAAGQQRNEDVDEMQIPSTTARFCVPLQTHEREAIPEPNGQIKSCFQGVSRTFHGCACC